MSSPRMVLFPYGQPANPVHQQACAEFAIKHGGDPSRIFDGPFPTVERFCDHVRRIGLIAEGFERPIIILTRTNPLVLAVVNARRKIESALPSLRSATWVVFVDPAEDPFFRDNAAKLGTLQLHPGRGVSWLGPEQQEYTVVIGPPSVGEVSGERTSSSRGLSVFSTP